MLDFSGKPFKSGGLYSLERSTFGPPERLILQGGWFFTVCQQDENRYWKNQGHICFKQSMAGSLFLCVESTNPLFLFNGLVGRMRLGFNRFLKLVPEDKI